MGIRSEKTFEDIVERLASLFKPQLSPSDRDAGTHHQSDSKGCANRSIAHARVVPDSSQDPAT
jgi:hypothetical protein